MKNIECIIFDWGGVLIHDPVPDLIKYCSKALGISTAAFRVEHKKLGPDFQKGLITEKQFWETMCSNLGVNRPESKSLWGDAFRLSYRPNSDVFRICAKLRNRGYRTALLSNTEIPAVKYFYELNYGCFDNVFFSCELKLSKPERALYELVLAELKSSPSQTLFIDDRIEYVLGARDVGIRSIQFESYERLLDQFRDYSINVDADVKRRNCTELRA